MRDTEFYVSHYFTWFHPANDIAWPRCPSKIDKLCDASECVNCAHLWSTLCLTVWLDIVSWVPCGVHEKPKNSHLSPKPSYQVPASQESWVSIQFLDMFVGSKTPKFQPFPQLFASLCRSPPAFPAFLSIFCCPNCVFGKFLPDLGLMIPVLSIQVTIAHCSSKNTPPGPPSTNTFEIGIQQFTKKSLTASDGSSTPSRTLSPLVTCSMLHQKIPERCQIWKFGSKTTKKVQPQLAKICWCEPKVRITNIDTKGWGFLVTSRDGDLDLQISFDYGAYAKHPLHILHIFHLSPWPFWLSSCFGSFGADHFAFWNRNLDQKLVANIWLPLWFLARRWTCQKSLASVRGCQCPMA